MGAGSLPSWAFLLNSNKVKKQTQQIRGDYLAHTTVGNNDFFNNCDIIEHQHVARV